MTAKSLPEWAVPGAAVVIHGGNAGAPTTLGTIARVEGQVAYVTSPAWAQGYERGFIPRRTQWQAASVTNLEEYGGKPGGYRSGRLCAAADSDAGRAVLRKQAAVTATRAATDAAHDFQRHPGRTTAGALLDALTEYMEATSEA